MRQYSTISRTKNRIRNRNRYRHEHGIPLDAPIRGQGPAQIHLEGQRVPKKIPKLHSITGWIGYCRAIAQGSRLPATQARLCLLLGGNQPAKTRLKLMYRIRTGQIEEDSYTMYSEAIEASKHIQ